MVRQILGAVSQFAKTSTVDQLRAARDRRSAALGRRVEGRKGYAATIPELVREAKRLRRASPKTGKRRTLAEIAAELARLGHVTSTGRPFAVNQVVRLLAELRAPDLRARLGRVECVWRTWSERPGGRCGVVFRGLSRGAPA